MDPALGSPTASSLGSPNASLLDGFAFPTDEAGLQAAVESGFISAPLESFRALSKVGLRTAIFLLDCDSMELFGSFVATHAAVQRTKADGTIVSEMGAPGAHSGQSGWSV